MSKSRRQAAWCVSDQTTSVGREFVKAISPDRGVVVTEIVKEISIAELVLVVELSVS